MDDRWVRENIDFEVLSESALARAQATIQNAMDQAKISRAHLARSMNRPPSFVSRILNGNHNLTIKTMARVALACGSEIDFSLMPVEWNPIIEEPQQMEIGEDVRQKEGVLLPVSLH